MPVADWAERNIVFREPSITGPFNYRHGRRYLAEPLDNWRGPKCSDMVLCWGTRCGKTRVLLVGAAWRIAHYPMRCLWTKPATQGPGGARNDAKTKWLPMLRASPVFAPLLTEGARRYDVTNLQQCIGGSIIDWIGTGSPKQLSSNPCDVTIQDEIDGYVLRGNAEAHPSALVDERTKDAAIPLRVKASTPTIEDGPIWRWLLRSDLRRRFVPCPLCNRGNDGRPIDQERFFVLAWSEQFTVLPKKFPDGRKIPMAFVRWDGDADIPDEPDPEYLRIASETAHFQCPFCGGRISDEWRIWMDEQGEWRPTQTGEDGVRGYHLASLYVDHPEMRLSVLVKKFLSNRGDPAFLRNFANADLAEAYVSQESFRQRTERIVADLKDAGIAGKTVRLMGVDVQQAYPYFWYAVREFSLDPQTRGNSCLIAWGHADSWDELKMIAERHSVPNAGIIVDAGFGPYEHAEVYRYCVLMATKWAWRNPVTKKLSTCRIPGALAVPVDCWMASKGIAGRKQWRGEHGMLKPWRIVDYDPYRGTTDAGRCAAPLLEYSNDYFLDRLESLRRRQANEIWAVPESVATEEYWRHMDGKVLDKQHRWGKRHRRWPDHVCDCEKMILVLAHYLDLMRSVRPSAPQAVTAPSSD